MNPQIDRNVVCEYLKDGALLVETSTQRAWKLNTEAASMLRGLVEPTQVNEFIAAMVGGPGMMMVGVGNGPKRRPGPRGASGPA